MSLEGSLETVALPEVLLLLSDTSKTGELLVRGDRGEGRLWFGAGRLTGFQVGRTEQADDALFDLLRTGEGRFSFEADAVRHEDAHAVEGDEGDEVRPVLEVAQTRLAEWTEIVAVVPSLSHVVSLAGEAPADGVHLEPSQWTLVVAIGEGRSVQDILDRASLPEFDGCRSLKVLVDAGLASVSEPVAGSAADADPEIVEEPVAEAAELVEEPAVEAHDGPAAVADEDPVAEVHDVAVETDHHDEDDEAEPVADSAGFELDEQSHEAALDPGEYVFGSSPSYTPAPEDPSAEDLAPWSIQLDAPSVNAAEDDTYVPQPVPFPEAHADEHVNGNGSHDSRAALEALIAEIPADDHDAERHDGTPDGLADRGPWTSHELASLDQMGGWQDEEHHEEATASHSFFDVEAHETAHAAVEYGQTADPVGAVHEYSGAEVEPVEDSDEEEEPQTKQPEPVNRGLLLKFLSSVRS